jgi:Protein of unknown function (DUF3108)
MAFHLKPLRPAAQLKRRAAWLVVLVGVIAVHGCVTRSVAQRMEALAADTALPPRIEVAYVREMALAAPPATAAPAAPAAAPPPRAARPKMPRPASAPEPKGDDATASVDESVVNEPQPAVQPLAPVDVAAADASAPASETTSPQIAAAASSAGTAAAPFEWPASTRMSYLLTGNYRGEVSGTAQVEWVREGARYQVHVDFIVGPSMAPLITQRSTSDGEITAQGLAPRRYDQDMRFVGQDRPRQTVLFDAGNVVLANGDVRPAVPGLQDTASQFVQLAYVFGTRPEMLTVGGSVEIPLALPKKIAVWVYDVVGSEVLNTSFGPVTGIHLKPRGNDQKAGTLSVEMWMAPQLRYLPVRIRFAQDAQTYVDLMIAKPPAIAN